MTRHYVTALITWVTLTAAGEALLFMDLFPVVGSHEAEEFDHIFRVLLIMGMPVFAFVVAVLVYAMTAFATRDPDETGPTIRGNGFVPRIWLLVTGALAVAVIVYPGVTGLRELQDDASGYGWSNSEPEMVVKAVGARWYWQFEYPEAGVVLLGAGKELWLPVDTTIRFDVEALDVVHSLWIPAFRMKIDAIPGRTTFMSVHPTELGTFAEDSAYRAQCAELCGLDHTAMAFPVKVVTRAEFEQWLAAQPKQVRGN
jgi:cytochrome c oxidase subunit 2